MLGRCPLLATVMITNGGWCRLRGRSLVVGWMLVVARVLIAARVSNTVGWCDCMIVGILQRFCYVFLKSKLSVFRLKRGKFSKSFQIQDLGKFWPKFILAEWPETREKFWLLETFCMAGKWVWMTLTALQIGFRMKVCHHIM